MFLVLAIPNGRECTCVSAFLDASVGRSPCDAQNCDQSSCAAIKNNYDASSRTFKSLPPVTRADGSNALRQREPKVYSTPFQVSQQDQDKLRQAIPASQQVASGGSDDQDQQRNDNDDENNNQRRPETPNNPNGKRSSFEGERESEKQFTELIESKDERSLVE